jgi:hypothetical protein
MYPIWLIPVLVLVGGGCGMIIAALWAWFRHRDHSDDDRR